MQEFVEDIHALLEELRVERCSIVSHSFGTLIAMEYTRAYPALVEHNIFLAPAYGVHHFKITKLLANLGAALAMAPLRVRAYGRTDYTRFYPTGANHILVLNNIKEVVAEIEKFVQQ